MKALGFFADSCIVVSITKRLGNGRGIKFVEADGSEQKGPENGGFQSNSLEPRLIDGRHVWAGHAHDSAPIWGGVVQTLDSLLKIYTQSIDLHMQLS